MDSIALQTLSIIYSIRWAHIAPVHQEEGEGEKYNAPDQPGLDFGHHCKYLKLYK